MKPIAKKILIILSVLCFMLLLSVAAFAVPSRDGKSGSCPSHTGKTVTLDSIQSDVPNDGMFRITRQKPTKNIPLVVIVIGFKNMPYSTEYDWGEEIFRGENSIKSFYTDMSFGQFTFVPADESSSYRTLTNKNVSDKANDGIIHVTLDVDHENWSMQETNPVFYLSYTRSMLSMFIKAINKADSFIDFSKYDDNGDGKITTNEMALGFVVAGYEAAYQEWGNWNKFSLWSHAWQVDGAGALYEISGIKPPVVDGVEVNNYIAIAENLEEGKQEPICVMAHELAHYLGIPDYYDTEYSTSNEWSDYTVGDLSVMCSGVWGQDPDTEEYIPASLDAFSRYQLGWIKPQYASKNGEYTLTSQNYDNLNEKISTVLIPTQNTGEYYLVENRQFTKWDRSFVNVFGDENENGGLVFWHIDYNIYNNDEYFELNTVNNANHRPAVMPLYPEYDGDNVTFIGDTVDLLNPFFDKDRWEEKYSSSGDALNLPLYKNNSRVDRWLSGIGVEMLTSSGETMTVAVDVDSHRHTTVHKDSEPTCTANGYIDCFRCTFCNKFFTDSEGTYEIPYDDAVKPKLGHSYELTKTVAPTIDNLGYELYTCTRCGYETKKNYKKFTGWGKKDGKWYLFDKNGVMLTGWQRSPGNKKMYYLGTDGVMQTGWQKIENKWYYLGTDGAMQTGWVKSPGNKKWYLLGTDGAMLTGWQKSPGNKKWYLLGTDGAMLTGWQKSPGNKKWYYLGTDGAMQTGWVKSPGNKKWYYLGTDGAMQTGWVKSPGNKKWYYLDTNGAMVANCSKKIGNKTYKFAENGVCLNP